MTILFHLVYPEKRIVGEETIRVWYSDAHANGEVEGYDDEPDTMEMAAALEDAGLITVSKTRIE